MVLSASMDGRSQAVRPFLLYGIPDSTVNIGFTANSGRIFEWYYFNVSQKLIFELKNNEYTLIEIKNLTDEVKID
jgi:hypothetical protein